ncbi:MAG TPA: hypothetical protein VGB68_08320 [Pyrinomonadaceae bacterium]|jgi:hypothetical protein
MGYIFVFLFIAIALIIILYYFFRTRSDTGSIGINKQNQPSVIQGSDSADSAVKRLPDNDSELMRLRQHLNTIVLHNKRLYQNNLDIARRDFTKRGLNNPSETELLKRAIEIWQDDNR